MKKFLTKLGNYNLRQRHNKMIFRQKFWNKTEVFARYFNKNINFCFDNSIFPSDLKVADVTLAFKKKSKTSRDNYRPISILLVISKIYDRCLYNQMQTDFDNILSKYKCGFRKGFNAQHYLVSMIEKSKVSIMAGRLALLWPL